MIVTDVSEFTWGIQLRKAISVGTRTIYSLLSRQNQVSFMLRSGWLRYGIEGIEKKNIKILESALSRWQVLVQSVAGGNVELDKTTLAVLRGRLVRYLMRSREVMYLYDIHIYLHVYPLNESLLF
ncbi:hypothetical protein ACJJTC_011589 [Scirpophaga incertulas]